VCIEEGGQQGVAAKRQQETLRANKIIADSHVPGVLGTNFSMQRFLVVY
jgi:hypothetical protein